VERHYVGHRRDQLPLANNTQSIVQTGETKSSGKLVGQLNFFSTRRLHLVDCYPNLYSLKLITLGSEIFRVHSIPWNQFTFSIFEIPEIVPSFIFTVPDGDIGVVLFFSRHVLLTNELLIYSMLPDPGQQPNTNAQKSKST
jgi:hypothetical protein